MLRHYTTLSLKSIGEYFEDNNLNTFDHATVLFAVNTVNDLRETNREFRDRFERIRMEVEKIKNS
jgi:chromosomal replication initiation ATPase DnaA